jgi:hypothetical protein
LKHFSFFLSFSTVIAQIGGIENPRDAGNGHSKIKDASSKPLKK